MKQKFKKTPGLIRRIGRTGLDLILNTRIEIGIGAGVLAALGIAIGHNINETRAKTRPVAFSEVGKTIQAYEKNGQAVPPLTRAYARCSDTVMRINEAHNHAYEGNGSHNAFAGELENKLAPEKRIHRQIGEDTAVIAQDTAEALQSLAKYRQANAALPGITSAFGNVWRYHRTDYDRTETYYEKECDSQRKNCRSVKKTREVYDHSIHQYTYNQAGAQQAAALLDGYLAQTPDLRITERLVLSANIDPENAYSIERSFREVLGRKIPTTAQALGLANVWATGSNFHAFEDQINQGQAGLPSLATAWRKTLVTARSHSYRTSSKDDDGPPEYRLARRGKEQTDRLNSMTFKVVAGLQECATTAPFLHDLGKRYVATVLDGKPGDADEMRAQLLALSDRAYKNNFAKGHTINRYSGSEVVFLGLGLGALGGLLGFGADKLIDYRRRRSATARMNLS